MNNNEELMRALEAIKNYENLEEENEKKKALKEVEQFIESEKKEIEKREKERLERERLERERLERERLEIREREEREIRERREIERREREERERRERREMLERERQEEEEYQRAINASMENERARASASAFAIAPTLASEIVLPPKGRRLPNLPPPKNIFEEIARLISYMKSKDKDKNIMPYNDELDNYLRNGESIIKIPLIVHYHNVSFYASRIEEPNLNIQTCRFNYNNDFIYLVRQYLLYSNDTQMKGDEKFINLEFRPHAFYMKREPNYKDGTNLSFKGRLEIVNLEKDQIISKDMVEVLSHHGIFSPGQNLLSFEELGINKDDDTKNYFFYVKFTPYNNPENNPYNSVFEIFRGIYWLSMMPENLIEETCESMLHTILRHTAIRGGSYSKRKLKNKSNKHKSNKHKSIKYKSIHKNKHKTYKKNKIHKTNKKT